GSDFDAPHGRRVLRPSPHRTADAVDQRGDRGDRSGPAPSEDRGGDLLRVDGLAPGEPGPWGGGTAGRRALGRPQRLCPGCLVGAGRRQAGSGGQADRGPTSPCRGGPLPVDVAVRRGCQEAHLRAARPHRALAGRHRVGHGAGLPALVTRGRGVRRRAGVGGGGVVDHPAPPGLQPGPGRPLRPL
ncbi:MAG: hypothetical protein AVDCRST_MAG10-1861, partial [uncultured Acidimicrobiales bacterium]